MKVKVYYHQAMEICEDSIEIEWYDSPNSLKELWARISADGGLTTMSRKVFIPSHVITKLEIL